MHNNPLDNQSFIDAAKRRSEDSLMYKDIKSENFLLVSGSQDSIRLLGEIIEDYEMACAALESVDLQVLKSWRHEAESCALTRAISPSSDKVSLHSGSQGIPNAQ